jgi:hypothetical protein
MNVSRILVTTASALTVLATIGCSSTRSSPEVAPTPMVVRTAPPEPMVVADAMPLRPALQNERTAEVVAVNNAPVYVTPEPVTTAPPAEFIERAPQADRN